MLLVLERVPAPSVRCRSRGPPVTLAPPPERVNRDEVFLEHTRSVCPVCKAVIDAEGNAWENKVFLRKRCRDHGTFEPLLYGDAHMLMDAQRFNNPGTLPLQTQTEVRDGCPLDCGPCPDHKQHACLGLIEVNTAGNLDCPVCFAPRDTSPTGSRSAASRSRRAWTRSWPPRANPTW
jgi:uncharacterized radical SAM superfamily Fe-S cluster-containing enzyme